MAVLLLTALATGLGGSFTPCTLGVNLVFLKYITGKSRQRRLWEWSLFALSRATFLTGLGLTIGLVGQLVQNFVWWFQLLISGGIVVLGVVFIVSRYRPLPVPALSFSGGYTRAGNASAVGLGMFFGLNISACLAPLVLALLGQTVLVGNWLAGAVALFLFGIVLSVPILAATASERAHGWIIRAANRYRSAFYLVTGGLLIVLGLAEIWLSFV
jgi:cytochrome c-type biogenesis protein